MDKAGDEVKARLREIVDELATEHAVMASSMFGMPSAKHVGGKAFLGVYGDDLVVKLPPERVAEALALPGAGLFDPMGGRPMKQWVRVPAAQAEQWLELARIAVQTDA